jgi:beta-xylosidase
MSGSPAHAQEVPSNSAHNPILWADVPDPSVIRVGDAYYMSSTTMHMSPGVPIMKSRNLVDWRLVNYVYDTLATSDAMTLRNGRNAYGEGSWASSLRYHDGTYYLATFSYTTQKTHIYRTDDVEDGPWRESTLDSLYHDPSLLFDNDRVFLAYGGGDIGIVELTADASSVKDGGLRKEIISNAGEVAADDIMLPAEGAHIHKVDGTYYIFLITWPRGGMRTQIVYRSDDVAGPYDGRVALQDAGIAQGGIVNTPEGNWYAMLFQDHGAVGRIPHLVPVRWDDGWPVFGSNGEAPRKLGISSDPGEMPKIVASDAFDYGQSDGDADLKPAWQWNHNPTDRFWSVTERPGYLRLTNGRTDTSFVAARNTLTQRTFGPQSAATIALDVNGLNPGDRAGLGLLQENYGWVGVQVSDDSRSLVMVNGSGEGAAAEVESIPLDQQTVRLGVEADFQDQTDEAEFYYSLDGEEWTQIGNTLEMSYELSHFMGYRFALFNYATEKAGGIADFGYYRVGPALNEIE